MTAAAETNLARTRRCCRPSIKARSLAAGSGLVAAMFARAMAWDNDRHGSATQGQGHSVARATAECGIRARQLRLGAAGRLRTILSRLEAGRILDAAAA